LGYSLEFSEKSINEWTDVNSYLKALYIFWL